MKPAKASFAAAIERAEKAMRQQNAGKTDPTAKERGHVVTKLSHERANKRQQKARQILCDVQCLGLDTDTLAKIYEATKAHAQSP